VGENGTFLAEGKLGCSEVHLERDPGSTHKAGDLTSGERSRRGSDPGTTGHEQVRKVGLKKAKRGKHKVSSLTALTNREDKRGESHCHSWCDNSVQEEK